MKFLHFTQPDGKTIAIAETGTVVLRNIERSNEYAVGSKTLIAVAGNTAAVTETMAEVEQAWAPWGN
jgi:hypothetical protein